MRRSKRPQAGGGRVNRVDHAEFFLWFAKQRGRYALSFNGESGEEARKIDVPKALFDGEFQIDTGMTSYAGGIER